MSRSAKYVGLAAIVPAFVGLRGLRRLWSCRCVVTGTDTVNCPCEGEPFAETLATYQAAFGFGAATLTLALAVGLFFLKG